MKLEVKLTLPGIVEGTVLGMEGLYNDIIEFFGQERFIHYNKELESKFTFNKIEEMPPSTKKVLKQMNSNQVLKLVERYAGTTVKPDHAYIGGGIHITTEGGILNPHKDYNILPATIGDEYEWQRAFNLIIYLNPYRYPTDGGELNIYESVERPDGQPQRVKYTKVPNHATFALFDTRDCIHGNSEPYRGEHPRVSLATYYYIPVKKGTVQPHSTQYYLLKGQQETEEEKTARIKRADVERYKGEQYKEEFSRFRTLNNIHGSI